MESDTVRLSVPVPTWPLPVGHRYGPQGFDLRNHDGRDSIGSSSGLRAWQLAYRQSIKRVEFTWGYYDAVTQMAAIDVQRLAGFSPTGLIDELTWAAVWTVEKPKLAPPEKPAPTPRQLRAKARRRRDYWRRVSQRADYVSDGSQPPWWPGRAFGVGEYGWHVQHLQRLLQARETGTFTQETARRVRAARRAAGLPVSDVCDLVLATVLDPGPW